jgi:hypothetical protein
MVVYLHLILRGGAVAARWAHNPKVGGSNPPSATKKSQVGRRQTRLFLLMDRRKLAFMRDSNKKAIGPAIAGLAFLGKCPI